MVTDTACYILLAEGASPAVANYVAQQYRVCPYVHFIGSFGSTLLGVWYLPESQRWWLELVAENPQLTLGLVRAAVFRSDMASPEPADRTLEVEDTDAETCPCGSDCRACDRFDVCSRCPATAFYTQGRPVSSSE